MRKQEWRNNRLLFSFHGAGCSALLERGVLKETMRNLRKVSELARDLRREDPRSAYEELGGETHAARTLDKCRATLVGRNGDYQFGCPMDQHFFEQTGIDMQQFEDFVATGADDDEVGRWIQQHTPTRR
jgi:hypothetical protein